MNLTPATASAALQAIDALLNAGSIVIYAGTNPGPSGALTVGNTILATFAYPATAYGAPAGPTGGFETATAGAIAAVTIANNGTAAFARGIKSDGTTVACDYSVSATGGGGEIQFPSTTFVQNTTVSISSMAQRFPVS